jgi:hypothetical protein
MLEYFAIACALKASDVKPTFDDARLLLAREGAASSRYDGPNVFLPLSTRLHAALIVSAYSPVAAGAKLWRYLVRQASQGLSRTQLTSYAEVFNESAPENVLGHALQFATRDIRGKDKFFNPKRNQGAQWLDVVLALASQDPRRLPQKLVDFLTAPNGPTRDAEIRRRLVGARLVQPD